MVGGLVTVLLHLCLDLGHLQAQVLNRPLGFIYAASVVLRQRVDLDNRAGEVLQRLLVLTDGRRVAGHRDLRLRHLPIKMLEMGRHCVSIILEGLQPKVVLKADGGLQHLPTPAPNIAGCTDGYDGLAGVRLVAENPACLSNGVCAAAGIQGP